MKKTFLKSVVATSVVATAVALSSVAAFAASGDAWTLDAGTMYAGNTIDDGKNDKPANISDLNGASLQFWTSNDTYGTFGAYATSKNKSLVNETGKTWTSEGLLGGGRTITIIPAEDGTITAYWYDGGAKNVKVGTQTLDATNYTIASLSDACKAGEAFTITGESNVALLEISFEPAVKTGTQYDESKFDDATVDNTVSKPGSTAKNSATAAEWVTATGIANTGAETGTVTTAVDAEIDGFKFVSAGRNFRYSYDNATIQTNGSSTSAGRYVQFTAEAGDCLKIVGYRSQNTTNERFVALLAAAGTPSAADANNSGAIAPAEATDTIINIPTAGTYYLCANAGIEFKGLELIAGDKITAPMISLSAADTTSYAGKVAFKGTITGDADDSLVINSINVVTAKGYDAAAAEIAAKTHIIDTVAEDGSNYAFIVTVDAASVDAQGLKIQANLTFDNAGSAVTNYSEVVTYTAE